MGTADYEAPIVAGRAVPSARAQALLLDSQSVDARAFLMGDDALSRVELPLVSGSVACDPGSVVRRSATLTVLGRWGSSDNSRLTPYGSRVQVQRGVQVALDAVEWITLMTGPIWEADQDDDAGDDGRMALPLKDEMATIARDTFDANTSTDTTLTVLAQITAWIRRTLPTAEIIDQSGALGMTACGKLDVQKDPAAGIAKLAASAGLEVFTGRGYQQFVIRPVPTLDDPPRWVIADDTNIIKRNRKRTRDRVWNRVLVTGETNDATAGGTSTPPPSGTATITDPADPLRYGGPVGRATKTVSMPAVKDNAQATIAASAWLQRLRGTNLQTSFTTLVNPALEGGDVFIAQLDDGRSVHIADAVDLPLDIDTAQSVATRGLDLPDDTA